MNQRGRSDSPGRGDGGMEVEFGGLGLILVGLVVLVLCAGSFWLGRWSAPARLSAAVSGTAADGAARVEEMGDVERDLTFFDELESAPELSAHAEERKSLPVPSQETADHPARAEPAPEGATPAPAKSAAGPADAYQIQVLATTEESAARALVARLQDHGFPARMVIGEREGQPLYRVRVVGFEDEAGAQQGAEKIRLQEGLQTWITR